MQIAEVYDVDVEILAELLRNCARNDDAARLRIGLKTCRDVYALAIDVIFLHDDVRSIQPHAKADALVRRHPRSIRGHRFLQRKGAARRISRSIEGCQETIAGILDDPSTKRRNTGVEDLRTQLHEPRVSVYLVRLHQSGIPNHVGCEDCR